MTDRPENVHCVKLDVAESEESWCGRRIVVEFHFVSTDHALINADRNGKLMICPDCADRIADALTKGTWAGEDYDPDHEQATSRFAKRLLVRLADHEAKLRETDPEGYKRYLDRVKKLADLFEAEGDG